MVGLCMKHTTPRPREPRDTSRAPCTQFHCNRRSMPHARLGAPREALQAGRRCHDDVARGRPQAAQCPQYNAVAATDATTHHAQPLSQPCTQPHSSNATTSQHPPHGLLGGLPNRAAGLPVSHNRAELPCMPLRALQAMQCIHPAPASRQQSMCEAAWLRSKPPFT